MTRKTFVKLEIAFLLAIPLGAFVLACANLEPEPFTSLYFIAWYYLVTGWASFLSRVLPVVVVDRFSLGVAGVSLIGLTFGLHRFCDWLHREIRTRKAAHQTEPREEDGAIQTWRFRSTLSILGIVLLMFVAGISAVGGVHQLIWLKTHP